MKKKRGFKKQGFSIFETLIAATITVSVLGIALTTFMMGMQSWYTGETNISSQVGAEQAIQKVERTLRQAMLVSVDANQLGLTYELPQSDAGGNFITPLVWDGVTRRVELDGTNLTMKDSTGFSQVICSNVVLTDPSSASKPAYVIFTAAPGAVTRSLTLEVISETVQAPNNQIVYGRRREDIYLRNVPQLFN